jgi:hypothetical protein
MASHGEQDLLPDQTEGFKVGEKKTLDEYKNMGKREFACICKYCLISYMISTLLISYLFLLHIRRDCTHVTHNYTLDVCLN